MLENFHTYVSKCDWLHESDMQVQQKGYHCAADDEIRGQSWACQ